MGMNEIVIPVVRCRSCRTVLFEPPGTFFEEREPCPACGSMERDVRVTLAEAIPADPSTVAASNETGG
jgi:rRNA maturation endonuclease Nob1